MPIAATSVVSAAVIGGDLILGLSDGAIINCGRVQGPQGLKGDQGPMGATGRAGTDGNTIHTVQGAPDGSLGRDGDFAINTVVWEIYGPRSGGTWGTGTPLRGNLRGDRESKDPIFGMQSNTGDGGGGGGGGGGQTYTTANLPLAGTGRLIEKNGRISVPGGNIIPEANGLKYQSNLNSWSYDSLAALDEALPINKVDDLPDEGKYEGDMVLHEGALWIWSAGTWIQVGGAVDTDDFATKNYANKVAFQTASIAATQVDWTNQTYSNGTWILQTGGAANPNLQRFIVTGEDFADTSDLGNAKYVSVHAFGGGDFVHYQNEKPGDTLQIYGNPLTGDGIASFGIYEIEEITEHNFPDNPGEDGADLNDAFTTYTVKPLAFYGTVEEDELCQIKTMPPVDAVGGGAETHVGEDPPADAKVGDLWYCTKLDDLTLYVLAEEPDVWAAAAPPVSLDGVREDMQNIDNTLAEVRTTLFAVDNDVKLVAQETTKELERLERGLDFVSDSTERLDNEKVDKAGDTMTGRLVTNSPIWIHPDGQGADGEHNMLVVNQKGADTGSVARFQQNAVDILKIEHARTINACGNNITNLADPQHERHATTKKFVEDNFIANTGANVVTDGWKIEGGSKTHFHVEGNQTKIYWLQDPDHAQHPVTMGWADNKYAKSSELSSYLPLKGGKLTGNLSFGNNARIDCNNGSTVLSGRGCFELRANAEKPLIFSSGSGSKKLLSFYGYDGSAEDNKSEKAYITAGGEARFKKVYSNGKELATQEYVDANAGGGSSEGAIAKSGSNTNPTLAKGELYLCTTDNTLRVGI